MNIEKFLISGIVFVFSVFLFEPMTSAIEGIGAEETLKPILLQIPLIFCVVLIVFPVYFLMVGGRD